METGIGTLNGDLRENNFEPWIAPGKTEIEDDEILLMNFIRVRLTFTRKPVDKTEEQFCGTVSVQKKTGLFFYRIIDEHNRDNQQIAMTDENNNKFCWEFYETRFKGMYKRRIDPKKDTPGKSNPFGCSYPDQKVNFSPGIREGNFKLEQEFQLPAGNAKITSLKKVPAARPPQSVRNSTLIQTIAVFELSAHSDNSKQNHCFLKPGGCRAKSWQAWLYLNP